VPYNNRNYKKVVCIGLHVFIHIKADKKEKDLFEWGYWTGLIINFIIDIISKILSN